MEMDVKIVEEMGVEVGVKYCEMGVEIGGNGCQKEVRKWV